MFFAFSSQVFAWKWTQPSENPYQVEDAPRVRQRLAEAPMASLTEKANDAARKVIAEAHVPEVVREMALWLTFECDVREGEALSDTRVRLKREAKKRWPQSTSIDYDRAEGLCDKALEVSNALLERGVDGHKLH